MTLAAGDRVGSYEIFSAIGAGGMGEVYGARDPRLNRLIAIKVLPGAVAHDPERRERFEREAQAIAALNHPNIVTIHSIEEIDGRSIITMELVEGRSLAEALPKSGLPLDRLLTIAIAVADALVAAHHKGITHRDLKPANIMLGEGEHGGRVKVLDFGLAKLADVSAEPARASMMPTAAITGEGRILGTVAYMSPEQAEGKTIDPRSDLFSLGVIVYEMATGQRPFTGDTSISIISSIVKDTPKSVTELNPALPRDLGRIVRRALNKDLERRYQTAKDLRNDLEDLNRDVDSGELLNSGATRGVSPARWWPRLLITLGVVTAGALGLAGGLSWLRTPPLATVGGGRLSLLVSSEGEARDPTLSPDGKMIAYIAGEAGHVDLYVSRVAGGERVRLTDDSALKADPSFSSDGERIAFSRFRPDGKTREICVVPALGGNAIPVISDGSLPVWSPDGTRLGFVVRRPGESDILATAAADGSDHRIVLKADANYPNFYRLAWSPNGQQIAIARSAGGINSEIWLVPAVGGPARRMWQDPSGVFSNDPVFTPDGRGIVHTSNRGGATNLWLMPVDGTAPIRITSGPGPDESSSVARNGAIAFLHSYGRATLLVHRFDTGETRTLLTHTPILWGPSFSPNGREIAFSRSETDGSWHIWTVPADGGTPRQVTSGQLPEIYPRYTPDGSAIVFQTWGSEARRIWRVPREGGLAVPLTPVRSEHDEYSDISPDGRWLAFARTEGGTVRVYIAPTAGGPARRLTDSPSTVPRWSADGQWIAFSPDRSPGTGVQVIRADGTGQRRLTEVGGWPVWWPDGKQIGYQIVGPEGNTQIVVVPFNGGALRTLAGVQLYGTNHPFDVSRDGSRLVTTNTQHGTDEIWLLEPAHPR